MFLKIQNLHWVEVACQLFTIPLYIHQFERRHGDQMCLDLLAMAPLPKKDGRTSVGTSSGKSLLFQPYPKGPPWLDSGGPTCHGSFHLPLCIHCGGAGHRASTCDAMRFTTFKRLIFVDWKSDRLVSKSGKHICLVFNIRGTCTTNPLHSIHAHGAHLCSLCGDNPATAREIELQKILYIHTTPYSVNSWTAALLQCNISEDFPNLLHDIKLGSPIDNPPPLTSTFLPRNLPSVTLYCIVATLGGCG